MKRHQFERHYVNRTGWLRAAVLGANDGLVSNFSLEDLMRNGDRSSWLSPGWSAVRCRWLPGNSFR